MRFKSTILALLAGAAVAGPSSHGEGDDTAQANWEALEAGATAYAGGDYTTAWGVFKVLAEQGQVQAAYSLGWMYSQGLGARKNYAKAFKWYRLAAEQGDAWSQDDLAAAYANGQGVPQNLVQAYKWIVLALERYPASEAVWRDRAFVQRDLIASVMTPTQLAQAEQLAREWKPEKVAVTP